MYQNTTLGVRVFISLSFTHINIGSTRTIVKTSEDEFNTVTCYMDILSLCMFFNRVLFFVYYIQKFSECMGGVKERRAYICISIAAPVILKGVRGKGAHFPSRILRPAPMFCPAWVAPLFWPA